MQVNADQEPYCLSELDNQDIFENDILPRALSDTQLLSTPEAIFLGGQSGSGKSSLTAYYKNKFISCGGCVVVNSGALREFHPAFTSLQKTNSQRASYLVNPDAVRWQQKLIRAAVGNRRRLLLDGTLGGSIEPIAETMHWLREQEYQLLISVLSVPARLSRFGIYKRYEEQIAERGSGRWVGLAAHDQQYKDIPKTLAWLEAEKLVDRIQLWERATSTFQPSLLYENALYNGFWEKTISVAKVLRLARNRRWLKEEKAAFRSEVKTVREQMQQRGATVAEITEFYRYVELPYCSPRVATPADVQLYFDWANDPLTRQQSFRSEPIPFATHEAWFARKIADPDALLLVFETSDNVPVGQVRFEKQPNGEAIIGLSVDAAFRGFGLAAMLIDMGCVVCREHWGDVPIIAYIKLDNQASIRAFERAGFVAQPSENPDRLRLVKH